MSQGTSRPPLSPEMKTVLAHINQQVQRLGQDLRGEMQHMEQRLSSGPAPSTSAPTPTAVVSEAATFNDLGVQLFYKNELDESLKHLTEATQLDPSLVEAWSNLGMVYSAMGRTEEAGEAFGKAVALNPNRIEVLCNQAVLCLVDGNADMALELLERAEEQEPRSIPVLLNLAHACRLKGEHARAIRAWKMVVIIDPENEEAQQCLRQYYQ